MNDSSGVQSRSAAVRGAARLRLKQLRAERLMRRGGIATHQTVPQKEISLSVVSMAVSRETSIALRESRDQSEPSPSPRRQDPADERANRQAGMEANTGDLAPENASAARNRETNLMFKSAAEKVDELGAPFEPDHQTSNSLAWRPVPKEEVPAASPRHEDWGSDQQVEARCDDLVAAPPESSRASTDLVQLPGAGAGLVWMLQSLGIDSLRDLAQADSCSLAARLGLVGQLVDLNGWITFAQGADRSGTVPR